MLANTEWMLREWAMWVKRDGGIGYPSLSLGVVKPPPAIEITDDMALVIDGAIARFKKRDLEGFLALTTYFLEGENYSHVGRQMGISNRRVEMLVRAGVCWVDGILEGVALTGT